MALLNVENLLIKFALGNETLHAVRGLDLHVDAGETLCIVGESGCGKSVTSLALMGLLPRTAKLSARRLAFGGHDLRHLNERQWSDLRGNRMAMIFQEPMTSLNPTLSVGEQLIEGFRLHRGGSRAQARDRAAALLERVGISAAARRLDQYPHQLSGGLRQRVMIAMALMCEPELIIADEPTTALDVTIQAQILKLLKELQEETGAALLLITHDLGVVAHVADRVAVMYAGEVVETGGVHQVFRRPSHPYTRGLMACIPWPGKTGRHATLGTIPGIVPSLLGDLPGCAFAERCPSAMPICGTGSVPLRRGAGGHSWRCHLEPEGDQAQGASS